MDTNREIVADAFAAWSRGERYVASIFAEDMTWEIVGRSRAAGRYGSAREFSDEVLHPFGARFRPEAPFRPVTVRGVYADGDVVVVLWDGEGTTTAGTTYRNTYAWFLTMRDGRVVDGTAFYDSIAFDELWDGVPPDASRAT
ncbi:nuclear transport factor 2 family protein [Geodermatophilus sp. SYSU D00766]